MSALDANGFTGGGLFGFGGGTDMMFIFKTTGTFFYNRR